MKERPWDFLNDYRGGIFEGQWPTLPEMVSITTERFPDNKVFTAFEPEYISLTYKELNDIVKKVAGHLINIGIKKGDKIGLTGKNSPEWGVAYLATLYAGGIIVPINYQLNKKEILHIAKLADIKVVFIDEEKYDDFNMAKYDLSAKISLSPNKPNYIMDIKLNKSAKLPKLKEDDLAAILYTSGTTGIAKGVMLTHKNFVSDCFLAQTYMKLYPTDIFYALLPLHHSYTMTAVFWESLSVGAEIVFGKRIASKQILFDLKHGKVTMFLGVPVLFNKLLKGILKGIREKGVFIYGLINVLMGISGFFKKAFKINLGHWLFKPILKKASIDRIRICISGGAPLASSTFKKYNQFGIDFVQGYGLTETSPIITLNPPDHYKESSVGKVLPKVDMRIFDPDTKGIGEILVKGPIVMQGYYENESATKEIFTEDGYLMTGDEGYLDKDNYLFLTGRKKTLIVTEGGKNVFPEEIEDKFQLYDEIEQILVRGFIKDKKMKTEDIEALVYPSKEYFNELEKKEKIKVGDQYIENKINTIIKEVNDDLVIYKKIKRVKILSESMEETTTRKIKRFKVKE